MSGGRFVEEMIENAARLLERACWALEEVLQETSDTAFGVNRTVVADLNAVARKYGVSFIVTIDGLRGDNAYAYERAARDACALGWLNRPPSDNAEREAFQFRSKSNIHQWCGKQKMDDDRIVLCTRLRGHTGDHVSCCEDYSDGRPGVIIARWT